MNPLLSRHDSACGFRSRQARSTEPLVEKSKRRKETENSIVRHMQHVRICYLQAQSGQGTFPYHHRGLLTPTRGSCALGKHARSCSRIHAAADAERSSSSMAGRIHTAAADAVFVFKEQKTELLLKITEKPIRRGKWLSKSTSLTSRT